MLPIITTNLTNVKTTFKRFLIFPLVSSLQSGAYEQDQTATLLNGKKVITLQNQT